MKMGYYPSESLDFLRLLPFADLEIIPDSYIPEYAKQMHFYFNVSLRMNYLLLYLSCKGQFTEGNILYIGQPFAVR